jgi:hypothetical protein
MQGAVMAVETGRNFVLKSCMLAWRKTTSMSVSKMSSLIIVAAASLSLTLGVAGCNRPPNQDNSTQNQQAPAQTDNSQTDQTQDPQAGANLAPVATRASSTNYQQEQTYSTNDSDGDYDAGDEDTSYGQPLLEAQQPPPQLPEHSQPDCPSDGYLWTP